MLWVLSQKFGSASLSAFRSVKPAHFAGKLTCSYCSISYAATQPPLVEILCFFQSKNSRCRKASLFSGKYRKTPQAVGKVTAAVFKFGVNRSVRPNGCSPFAARLRLLTITGELLSEDQIVHVPVFPYTVPDTVWLTLHHRHADSPPGVFDWSERKASEVPRTPWAIRFCRKNKAIFLFRPSGCFSFQAYAPFCRSRPGHRPAVPGGVSHLNPPNFFRKTVYFADFINTFTHHPL